MCQSNAQATQTCAGWVLSCYQRDHCYRIMACVACPQIKHLIIRGGRKHWVIDTDLYPSVGQCMGGSRTHNARAHNSYLLWLLTWRTTPQMTASLSPQHLRSEEGPERQ